MSEIIGTLPAASTKNTAFKSLIQIPTTSSHSDPETFYPYTTFIILHSVIPGNALSSKSSKPPTQPFPLHQFENLEWRMPFGYPDLSTADSISLLFFFLKGFFFLSLPFLFPACALFRLVIS